MGKQKHKNTTKGKRKAAEREAGSPVQNPTTSTSQMEDDAPVPAKEMKLEAVETLPTRSSLKETISAFLEKDALVVLKGPIGCGKSTLACEIAQERGLPLRIIQMGDQMDAKALFGSYQCTETPGGFVWKPSSFTKYLREDCIVLLEDLDCAFVDVVSAIITLCEKRKQELPSGETVEVKPKTKIIATVRTSTDKKTLPPIFNGTPCHVELLPFTDEELRRTISNNFPKLNTRSQNLVEIFTFLHRESAEILPLPTDLFRACARLQKNENLNNTQIFKELVDVLTLHSTTKDKVMLLGECVGKTIKPAVNATTINQYLLTHRVDISWNRERLRCGRAVLARHSNEGAKAGKEKKYTVEERILLERLAVAVQHNEPVLLSGPNMSKTVAVEMLAGLVNAKLHIVNPSQHDDSPGLTMDAICHKLLHKSLHRNIDIHGVVVEAAEKGEWLLIEDINLASSECLDAIVQVLDDIDKTRHADFRLFACMTPATDTGKRNLAMGVRARFTEMFIHETTDPETLDATFHRYLPSLDGEKLDEIRNLFLELCKLVPKKYSLRTLCQALSFAAQNMFGTELRSLFEAFQLAFVTDLDAQNTVKAENMIAECFREVSKNKLPRPAFGTFVEVEGCWVAQGPLLPATDAKYVLTPSVKKKLAQLARALSHCGRIVVEGETSAGKTSMVTHLAKITGNKVIRINNHERTDLQEYIGSYSPDSEGKLQFTEGALLKAVRNGDWVILDELNLAPTDVIWVIHWFFSEIKNWETFTSTMNIVGSIHPSFRLFVTQNPVGAYAGRKKLPRDLLKQSITVRFQQLPAWELIHIVEETCIVVAPSSAGKMIAVLEDLRIQRSLMGVFSARDGLMTLRDVFRWAGRLAASDGTDWQQTLADQGYMLLGGRCRNAADEKLVKETLEKHLKRTIKPEALFAMGSTYMPPVVKELKDDVIVWTYSMRRMAVLCHQAWICDEPVLMVGGTGCGKTVAQKISRGNYLFINCHERTETADLLGRLHPHPDGPYFVWKDGVVVEAIKQGTPLLIDEISLAADSVLERLNPLLESSRSLCLTESGTNETVSAAPDFQVVATMNPGGDNGKKELSKALRNRFTEFWCVGVLSGDDLEIIQKRLRPSSTDVTSVASAIIEFVAYFSETFAQYFRRGISIRDIVALVDVFNACLARAIKPSSALFCALKTVLFDCLDMMQPRMSFDKSQIVRYGANYLAKILGRLELLAATVDPPRYDKKPIPSEALPDMVADFRICFGPRATTLPSNDLSKIIEKRLRATSTDVTSVAAAIVEFVAYFSETFAQYFRRGISIRDIVALVDVFNACLARAIKPSSALFHAFHMVLFDCLVMIQPSMSFDKKQIVRDCANQLAKILERKKLMTSTEKPPEFDNITVNLDLFRLDGGGRSSTFGALVSAPGTSSEAELMEEPMEENSELIAPAARMRSWRSQHPRRPHRGLWQRNRALRHRGQRPKFGALVRRLQLLRRQ